MLKQADAKWCNSLHNPKHKTEMSLKILRPNEHLRGFRIKL